MISFIVPAYNEEHELSGTLAAIHDAASGASGPYEIIVVDDASTDATPEIAAQAGARVIRINRRQIAAARNAGGRAAQGDYLFFIDADTRINRAHVTGAIAAMEAGYVGGSARVNMDGLIPIWGRMLLLGFSSVYFGLNLGAGAFLFTTRHNFDLVYSLAFGTSVYGKGIHLKNGIRRPGLFLFGKGDGAGEGLFRRVGLQA